MGLVTNLVDFTPGTPILASEVNGNFDNIVQVVNGGLDDSNVAGFTAAVIAAGEFDLDRIPQLPGDRVDTAWGDVSGKPAQATRWPTWGEVTGKPDKFPPESHTHGAGDITSGTLSVNRGGTGTTSLTSGNYLRGNGTGAIQTRTASQVRSDIGAAASSHTHPWGDITGKPPQATRWPSYAEVTDTPTNLVRTNTAQTISNTKTFTGTLNVTGTIRIPVR